VRLAAGQMDSRFCETGFGCTLYFARTLCAWVTHAAEGDVSRMDSPAMAS